MTDPDSTAESTRSLGRLLAHLRQTAGHTQHTLAPLIHYHRSTIANVETGRQQVNRDFWARCDDVLGTGGVLVGRYEQIRATSRQLNGCWDPGSDSPLLAGLRRKLLAPDHRPSERASVAPADVRIKIAEAHLHYQRADYSRAARLLPDVLAHSETAVGTGRVTLTLRALANLAASKLAVKLGDASLAWVAADRAARDAANAEAANLAAAAAYSVGCALLAMPNRLVDAAEVVTAALESTDRRRGKRKPAAVSVCGALTLLAALVAARQARHTESDRYLDDATDLAGQLGADRNDLWTGFGATNVLIHRVGVAAGQRPDDAIELGEQLDTSHLPPALLSRRSQVHLDLATAFAHRPDGDASAVLHLLEAERIAPQIFRVHEATRRLVGDLLARERRSATPGLRGLAARAGLAA